MKSRRLNASIKIWCIFLFSILVLGGLSYVSFYDIRSPEITIIYPTNNSCVSGEIVVEADVVAYQVIYDVKISFDNGTSWKSMVPKQGGRNAHVYLHTWDTTQFLDGNYTLILQVKDVVGHERLSKMSVCVDNDAPMISLLFPFDVSTKPLSGKNIELLVNAADLGNGLDSVTYRIDNSDWEDMKVQEQSTLYETIFDPDSYSEGEHILEFKAQDKCGRENSIQYPITIDKGDDSGQDDSFPVWDDQIESLVTSFGVDTEEVEEPFSVAIISTKRTGDCVIIDGTLAFDGDTAVPESFWFNVTGDVGTLVTHEFIPEIPDNAVMQSMVDSEYPFCLQMDGSRFSNSDKFYFQLIFEKNGYFEGKVKVGTGTTTISITETLTNLNPTGELIIEGHAKHAIDMNFEGVENINVHDIDTDGDPDVVVTSYSMDEVVWYEAPDDPTGIWIKHNIDTNLDGAHGVYVYDIDGDGNPDVVATGAIAYDIVWYEAPDDPTGTWTKHNIETDLVMVREISVYDIDGDGNPDIAATSETTNDDIAWYEAPDDPTGTWIKHVIESNADGYQIEIEDIDVDGNPDAVITRYQDDEVVWYEAPDDPTGSWTTHTIDNALDGALGLYMHDIDADGNLDAVAAGVLADDIVWYEAPDDPTGSWTKHTIDNALDGAQDVYACDFVNNGNPDVVANTETDKIVWYEAPDDPTGSWTKYTIETTGYASNDVYVNDIDTDGIEDVIVTLASDDLVWYHTVCRYETASWTVMVYLDADNDLEEYGFSDLNEMEYATSSPDVNIIVQMDKNSILEQYETEYDWEWTGTRRYYIAHDLLTNSSSLLLEDLGEVNMGDPSTLSDFAAWAMNTYTADHYILVLWDHGGGWIYICVDDTINHSFDFLTMAELQQALSTIYSNTGVKLDILGLEACLMGAVEVAYQIKDYADIMIGSEQTIPGFGWPFHSILGNLTDNPTMTASELATTIVINYNSSYNGTSTQLWGSSFHFIIQNEVTLAAVNLTRISNLVSAINTFSQELTNKYSTYSSEIVQCRNQVEEFYNTPFLTVIDMYHFTQLIYASITDSNIQNSADQVMNALFNTIIAEAHGSKHPNSYGLSIYFPESLSWYDSSYESILDFTAAVLWDEFLNQYYIGSDQGTAIEITEGTTTGSLPGPSSSYGFWYKIFLDSGETIVASLTGETGTDFDMAFYDTDGSTLLTLAEGTTYPDPFSYTVSADGYYFIHVYPYMGSGDFQLTITITAPGDGGNGGDGNGGNGDGGNGDAGNGDGGDGGTGKSSCILRFFENYYSAKPNNVITLSGTLRPNLDGKLITITFNGNSYTTYTVNGTYSITITVPSEYGIYMATARFSGNNDYSSASCACHVLVVEKETNLRIFVDGKLDKGETVQITVTLTTEDGDPIVGEVVTIYIYTRETSTTTSSSLFIGICALDSPEWEMIDILEVTTSSNGKGTINWTVTTANDIQIVAEYSGKVEGEGEENVGSSKASYVEGEPQTQFFFMSIMQWYLFGTVAVVISVAIAVVTYFLQFKRRDNYE